MYVYSKMPKSKSRRVTISIILVYIYLLQPSVIARLPTATNPRFHGLFFSIRILRLLINVSPSYNSPGDLRADIRTQILGLVNASPPSLRT